MLVAMVSVHLKNGFFATNNGIETAFLYAAAALGLACTGGGAYSLDAGLGLRLMSQLSVTVGLIVLAVVGAAVTLALRHHPQPQAGRT
jgi:uncharacterized membrane protein YphA (DoxX/SURF4 family)